MRDFIVHVVLRGGSWANGQPNDISNTYRPVGISTEYSESYGGFRCIRRSREPLREP